jgi:hypothetical protein
MKPIVSTISLIVLALLVSACGTSRVGSLQTQNRTVDLGDARSATVNVTMGAGTLNMSGEASALMEAVFTFNVAAWEPTVTYSVSNGRGQLAVSQSQTTTIPLPGTGTRNEWMIRLNDDVPIDFSVSLGAGESTLNLASVSIANLQLQSGASSTKVGLPAKSLTTLNVKAGVGEVTLDFTGDWQQNLSGIIQGGVGSATLLLPSTTGVRVTVTGGLGSVSAPGFQKQGNVYTNDAYGTTAVALALDVTGGVGEVKLQLR